MPRAKGTKSAKGRKARIGPPSLALAALARQESPQIASRQKLVNRGRGRQIRGKGFQIRGGTIQIAGKPGQIRGRSLPNRGRRFQSPGTTSQAAATPVELAAAPCESTAAILQFAAGAVEWRAGLQESRHPSWKKRQRGKEGGWRQKVCERRGAVGEIRDCRYFS